MTAVTPRSPSVFMQRSQRTGAATCSTRRPTNSGPCWITLPSAFDNNRVPGSDVGRPAASCRRRSTAGAMWAVWNAPATASGRSRAPSGGSAASAANCSAVPAATTWPAAFTFAAVRPSSASLASTASASPPRIAVIPVGRGRGGAGHRAAALAHQHKCRFRRQDAGQCRGGDLADTVAGDGADVARDVVERVGRPTGGLARKAELWLAIREKHRGGCQAGAHEEGLRDRGVFDLVGLGGRAEPGQVEVEHGRPPGHRVGDTGQIEPGRKETGNLGALTGREQREHESTLPCRAGLVANRRDQVAEATL